MQSTGVYWFAVYDVLEKHGLKVFLVNASHRRTFQGVSRTYRKASGS